MADHADRVRSLETKIASLESHLQALRDDLSAARRDATSSRPSLSRSSTGRDAECPIGLATFESAYGSEVLAALGASDEPEHKRPLDLDEYKRYGRQMIMPEIGLPGQLRLKKARVLIVGVGGLGCPASMYLAGAGVGTLGLVDGDEVEISNLHRQVLHNTDTVGMGKVDSAILGLRKLNPVVKFVPYHAPLSLGTALETFAQYDLVLDCTDNPATRYLISDTCVLLRKPLVSASALRTEGQLMVLNYPARPAGDSTGGSCYRCVFPKPPPAETVVTCGDGGILGPVVGVMGVLQALEAIKVITAESTSDNPSMAGLAATANAAFPKSSLSAPSLLIFSAYSNPQFRSIKLRTRSPKCAACSSQAIITPEALNTGSMDYVQFCGITNPVNLLKPEERVSAKQYAEARKKISLGGKQHRLIDVREKVQYDLCHLHGSINIPFSRLSGLDPNSIDHDTVEIIDDVKKIIGTTNEEPLVLVCRLGNDSQIAVRKLKELGLDEGGRIWVGDVRGGFKAWRADVDASFPDY